MQAHELHECKGQRITLTQRQQKLNIPTMSKQQQESLDDDFASICYEEGLAFSIFESPAMKQALYRLNPSYKPLTRQKVAGPLLEKAYVKMQHKVDDYLNSLSELNIIVDESSNINKSRIANISINTPIGSFHWLSEDLGSMRSTSANMADWLERHLHTLTKGNLTRVNCCATDTCKAMMAMWELIRAKPGLQHIFVVPCDSHGIQLLIQDLINSIPQFKKVHEEAQTIAKAFKNAPLQYARLRDLQREIYDRTFAIILAVATRWGTEKGLYDGLHRSKEAIQRYALRFNNPKDSISKDALSIALSSEFWTNLEKLRVILKPLDDALKMSESNKSTLAHVLPRWNSICVHLEEMNILYQSPEFDRFMTMERDQDLNPLGTFLQRFNIYSYHYLLLDMNVKYMISILQPILWIQLIVNRISIITMNDVCKSFSDKAQIQ